MPDWIEQNSDAFIWVSIASAVFFVASIVFVGVFIVRMPADAFSESKRKASSRGSLAWKIARNVLGWLLILAGAAMLVLPGQGLLVLFIGVMLADFPGKYRVERWILSRKKIRKTINWLRRKFGKEPLKDLDKDHAPQSGAPAAAVS